MSWAHFQSCGSWLPCWHLPTPEWLWEYPQWHWECLCKAMTRHLPSRQGLANATSRQIIQLSCALESFFVFVQPFFRFSDLLDVKFEFSMKKYPWRQNLSFWDPIFDHVAASRLVLSVIFSIVANGAGALRAHIDMQSARLQLQLQCC